MKALTSQRDGTTLIFAKTTSPHHNSKNYHLPVHSPHSKLVLSEKKPTNITDIRRRHT